MTKHARIVALLETGMSTSDVAKKLRTNAGYVRAVKAREWGNGRANDLANKKRRYQSDPAWRARKNARQAEYRAARRAAKRSEGVGA